MKYTISCDSLELWAWVKSMSTKAGVTINEFILSILIEAKYADKQTGKRLRKIDE